ncbi:ferritin [Lentzea sp. NBRC 105346]|uniref:ferritin n=1 Tax=Lentzea sp. NBRC 105346 TaxID=3032205 RepID=UPI0024A4636E|nr:ferritin [Lentzea sp. NBRC 105346]GLZ32590.1 ferritin [Lentzea sp. NBRC 105346]
MASNVKKISPKKSKFHDMLQAQVANEFAASQQYIALAVWFDNQDLPRLASHFYKQSLEERNHAMMIVQYLMDNDLPVTIPGVGSVRNEFKEPKELVELALAQEKEVTDQIVALAKAAREEGDYLGEQFLQWFLKEQVEEVSSMSTLLTVMERADGNMFYVENFLVRESVGDDGADAGAPRAAGGAL